MDLEGENINIEQGRSSREKTPVKGVKMGKQKHRGTTKKKKTNYAAKGGEKRSFIRPQKGTTKMGGSSFGKKNRMRFGAKKYPQAKSTQKRR